MLARTRRGHRLDTACVQAPTLRTVHPEVRVPTSAFPGGALKSANAAGTLRRPFANRVGPGNAGVQPSVLIIEDEEDVRSALAKRLRMHGCLVEMAATAKVGLKHLAEAGPDILLLDYRLPDADGLELLEKVRRQWPDVLVVMMTAYTNVDVAIHAIRLGAYDYVAKPFSLDEMMVIIDKALETKHLRTEVERIHTTQIEEFGFDRIVAESPRMLEIITLLKHLAESEARTILLQGESGTGKDLVAKVLHYHSPRASRPFMNITCTALPETLLESELFGHEKGAFTGAERQKAGKFEIASGGTLFLDEISNMPPGCQAKLLRALQDKSVPRVGGTKPVSIDIRLLAATNRDLETAVSAAFRRDLFFRLNEFTIAIPPLRERKQDIIFLAKRFLDLTNHELQKGVRGFSEPAVERLLRYDWPGNVRELRSAIRRAVLLADQVIDEDHLGLQKAPQPPVGLSGISAGPNDGLPLKELVRRTIVAVERATLIEVLKQTGGNKAKAARLLQIDYKTIHVKVKEYGITTQEVR